MKSQMSVSELPEERQDAAMRSVEYAREAYQQRVIEGVGLHVCNYDGEWQVWLNCEDAEFTGLCVSVGTSRDAAVADAVKSLEAILDALQGPPQ